MASLCFMCAGQMRLIMQTTSIEMKQPSSYSAVLPGMALLAALVLLVPSASAKNEYLDGVDAYIEGDYEGAQTHWLSSAKTDDYRAMFNLGLLHQQSLLPNSDLEKAKRWFRLAGQGGYAPADYHHAVWLLEQGDQGDETLRFLKRAADNGYYPAQQKFVSLTGIEDPELDNAGDPDAAAAQSVEFRSEQFLSEQFLSEQFLSEQWLEQRDSAAWTIQVLAFEDLTSVKAFISKHDLYQQAAYFAETSNGKELYKLVVGEFSSKEEAENARASLDPDLQEYGPWLRTFASVKRVISER